MTQVTNTDTHNKRATQKHTIRIVKAHLRKAIIPNNSCKIHRADIHKSIINRRDPISQKETVPKTFSSKNQNHRRELRSRI